MSLAARAWLSCTQLILALSLLLFVPAWDFSYWHAWWYIAVFGACVSFGILYLLRHDRALLERRLRIGPFAEQQRSQKMVMTLAVIAYAAMYLLCAFDYRFGWSEVPAYAVEIGYVLIVFGFTIVFLVFRVNSHTAGTIGVESGQRVVEDGPYGIVRHPMYVGALIFLFGTPLALGSWWGMAALAPIIVSKVWRIVEEEKFLKERLPGYDLYMRHVQYRLIPGIF